MKVAPLQPKGIVFEEVSIEVEKNDKGDLISTENFDFQNVKLTCEVGHGDIVDAEHKATDDLMIISVRLRISNTEGKKAPYKLNVAVTGIFKWLDNKTSSIERRDLMVVNGASMLYGSIREMVLTVTSRSMCGALLLPSFNFIDNKPSIAETTANSEIEKAAEQRQ